MSKWRNQASLTMSAVSSTFRAHYCMHSEKSAISLSLKVLPFPTVGSLVIRSGQDTRSDPCISSVAPAIMITTSNSPAKGERAAQSITRCWTAHHGLVRAGPRANRTFSLARNPTPCATSNTEQSPSAAPSPPWRSSFLVAWPGGNTCCAIPECFVP